MRAGGMTAKATRRALWVASLLTVPVPFSVIVAGGWAPTAWLAFVGALTGIVGLTEDDYAARLFGGLFVAQAAAATLVLYLGARLGARLVVVAAPPRARGALVAVVIALLLTIGLLDLYRTPLVRGGQPTNLLGLVG
jgi:hypothetical protein